jgi:uncharacterized protein
MSDMHSAEAIMSFTTITFLLAGLAKGVIGMGLPTIAVGLLAKVMAPAQAVALLLVPSLATNLWQLAAGPCCARLLRRLWPMMLGIGGGTWAGAGLLSQDADGRASLTLGAALVVYAILGLTRIEFAVPPRWETWLSLPVGAVTGLVTAATGVFVVPAVPYLGGLGLAREELVQALGLSFTVSTLAVAGSLLREGAIGETLASGSLLALAPALIGMLAGQRIRHRVRPASFRLCFFLALLGLGADQLARLVD